MEFRIESPSASVKRSDGLQVRTAFAGSNYFETFQQALVTGRLFSATEIGEGRKVAIVDETFVRQVFGGKSAIGQTVRQSRSDGTGEPGPWLEIVGVVKDSTLTPNKTMSDAMLYRPPGPEENTGSLYVHSQSSDAAARIRDAANATDSRIRLARLTTVAQHAETDARMAAFFIKALGTIAGVTMILAAAGIYSLISFTLDSRRREIGIRTALGAAPLRIVRAILAPAFLKVCIGIVLGSLPGVAMIQAALNWSIDSRMTWMALGSVTAFIAVVAIISCIWPVRRALRIQPTEALRTT